jgi:hypothetical protein
VLLARGREGTPRLGDLARVYSSVGRAADS